MVVGPDSLQDKSMSQPHKVNFDEFGNTAASDISNAAADFACTLRQNMQQTVVSSRDWTPLHASADIRTS